MRTKVGDRIRVNFYIDSQIIDAMQKIAYLKNTSYSELIRRACLEYVVREAPAAMASAQALNGLGALAPVPVGTGP